MANDTRLGNLIKLFPRLCPKLSGRLIKHNLPHSQHIHQVFHTEGCAIIDSFIFALMIGGAVGILVGLIPFIIAKSKKQRRLGYVSLYACLISGLIGGLLIAIPVGIFFTWYIYRKPEIINICPICGDEMDIKADVCKECAKDLDIIE